MKPIDKRFGSSVLAALLPFLLLLSYTSSSPAQSLGAFSPTGSMTTARSGHTATLLADGRVFIAGGSRDRPTSTEIYDPSTGMFTATGNLIMVPITATLLFNGKVLITGQSVAELYDPANGTFTLAGNMINTRSRFGHTATMLANGRVLIVDNQDGVSRPAEVYDSATDAFLATGGPIGWYGQPTTTLLPDGRVYLNVWGAELYDPATGTFSRAAAADSTGGDGHTATLLMSGKVLVTGGDYEVSSPPAYAGAELYAPSTDSFTVTGNMTTRRWYHTATLLTDGTVLIAGSDPIEAFGGSPLASAELYYPVIGRFFATGNMTTGRSGHTATLLADGRVLIAGGAGASAEVYTPATLLPALAVTDLQFDRIDAVAGSSYSANISGSNLTPETIFDVRFTSPGSSLSGVALNWQKGVVASHDVPAGAASGVWRINGIRAHRVETDHTGDFVPVSATITVSP
jgi:hypothetical protein